MTGADQPWGERLADRAVGAGGDEPSVRRLLREAVGIVRDRLGDVSRQGIRPLLDEAAAQVRPATLEELRARYPGLHDDEVARRLIDRAARMATAVALGIGGVVATQEAIAAASAAAPRAAGTALGAVGVTALAEVLVLFVIEAKLRADLGALAGQRQVTPSELVASVLGEVQAAGGFTTLRRRSLSRAFPEAAARRAAARIASLIPARFARIVVPEVIAPLVGAAYAARLAARQVRAAGEDHWAELRGLPRTTVTWGQPTASNGSSPYRNPGPGAATARDALPAPGDEP